jgi:uncharacterized phiE125 gp8 family phage protein
MNQLNVVSLAEAKLYLRIDPDDTVEDGLITSLIKSAVNQAEQFTLQILWQRELSAITPVSGILRIFDYPIVSIENVKDPDLATLTFETIETQAYTEVISGTAGLNTVNYVAGYGWNYDGGSEVPDDIETAIKTMIAYYYENRDNPVVGMPTIATLLLSPYRRITLF